MTRKILKPYPFLHFPLSTRLKAISRSEKVQRLCLPSMIREMKRASAIVKRLELNPIRLNVSWTFAAIGVSRIDAGLGMYLDVDERRPTGLSYGWHQYVEAGLLDIKRSSKLASAEEEAQRLQLHFKFDDDTYRVCLGFVDLLDEEFHWVQVLRRPRESLRDAVSRVGEELRRRDLYEQLESDNNYKRNI